MSQRPITYCSVNFAESGEPFWLSADNQQVDQWSMILQLQDLAFRRVELHQRHTWLFLGDMLVLKLKNPETQRLVFGAIQRAPHVVINDLVHAEEGQHDWLRSGLPSWMPRRNYVFVTNARVRSRSNGWLSIYRYDFLFNRTKAYYCGFPFTGSPWYFGGRENYRAPAAAEDPERKTKIFLSPCRLYLDYNRTHYREKLFSLLAKHEAIGHRSGPGRVRNNERDKSRTGLYLTSTTDDPLINFAQLGWQFDPVTRRTHANAVALKRWKGARWQGYSPIHNYYYDDTFISIYAETLEYGESIVVTEKTYEPLIKGHFILPFGTRRLLASVRKQGFLLPSFIDYSYDDVVDDDERFSRYAAEVRRLVRLPLRRWREAWTAHLPTLRHNQRLFQTLPYDRLPFLAKSTGFRAAGR